MGDAAIWILPLLAWLVLAAFCLYNKAPEQTQETSRKKSRRKTIAG